ncbi:conjugal transfer protein TraF [bacterium]|nr:conjugal transfer protein TraF [bacterium]
MTTRKKIFVLAFAFFAGLSSWGTTYALQPVQARDVSMGMTSAADAVGVRVVGLNPAFLAFKDQPKVTISIPVINFGFRFGNNVYSNKDVFDYFRSDMYWTDEIKQILADKVDQDKLNFTTDWYARFIGFSFPTQYLTMAFTYDMGMSMDADLDDEFTDLALLGNPVSSLGELKEFSETDMSGVWLSRLGFTFAKNFNYAEEVDWLEELTAGVTFNYFLGHAFADVDEFEASFLTDYDGTRSYAYFEVVGAGQLSANEKDDFYSDKFIAGNGVGVDLGIGMKLLKGRATAGLSIINLINQMTWDEGKRAVYAMDLDGLSLSGMNDENYWEDYFEPVDSLFAETENLKTELPRLIKLNGAYVLNERITLTGGITAQTNDVIGADAFLRAGMGIQHYTLDWFNLRGGASVGGRSGVAFGLGFGLRYGFWQTDVGLGWEHGMFDFAKGMRFGISSIFVFDQLDLYGIHGDYDEEAGDNTFE